MLNCEIWPAFPLRSESKRKKGKMSVSSVLFNFVKESPASIVRQGKEWKRIRKVAKMPWFTDNTTGWYNSQYNLEINY